MSTQAISVLVQQLVTASKGRRRRPSQRNIEIHEAVRVGGQTQLEAAARHRITQRRVSAICRQVDRWRADEEAGGELTADVRQRAERWVARKRLEKVYGWSIRGLETSGETLRTSVNRRKGNELIEVQTISKDQHYDVRWAKMARDSAAKLLELSQRDEPEAPPSNPRDVRDDRIVKLVVCLRRAIRQAAASGGAAELVQQIIESCLPAPAEKLAEKQSVLALTPESTSASPAPASYAKYSEPRAESAPVLPLVIARAVAPTTAAASTSNQLAPFAPAEKHAKGAPPENAFRTGSQTGPAASTAYVDEKQLADEERRVLQRLTDAYGQIMRPGDADDQLSKFHEDRSHRYPRWTYSREQRQALADWQRLRRAALNLSAQPRSDTMSRSAPPPTPVQ